MPDPKKTALVISGGGAKGAFAVGIVKNLFERFSATGWFSILGGTSTGALIAPITALMAAPEPVKTEALNTLVHLYSNVTTGDILDKKDITELIQRLDCLYESDPLNNLIHQNLKPEWFDWLQSNEAPDCYVVYTNYQTGQKKAVSPKDNGMNRDKFIKAMLASASVPVIMEAVTIEDDVCYDGGVRDLLPFSNAIKLGAEVILPIFLDPPKFNETRSKFRRIDKVLLRTLEILVDEAGRNDLDMANMVNFGIKAKNEILELLKDHPDDLQKVKRIFERPEYKELFGEENRLIEIIKGLRPSINLTDDSLTFEPSKMRYWLKWGEEKAESIIGENPFI
jgi:NTE family protein